MIVPVFHRQRVAVQRKMHGLHHFLRFPRMGIQRAIRLHEAVGEKVAVVAALVVVAAVGPVGRAVGLVLEEGLVDPVPDKSTLGHRL